MFGIKRQESSFRMVKIIFPLLFLAAFTELVSVFPGSRRQRGPGKQIEEIGDITGQQTGVGVWEPGAANGSKTIPGETKACGSSIDFDTLREVNPDVIAWITIPGTGIDYPVVQTDDNETYLKRAFDGSSSAAGAVYLDCDSDSDLLGMHSIFYGHHMRNGSMFAELVKFKDEDFFKEHREIILYTPERKLRLRTIAALYGGADGEKRRTQFGSEEGLQQYVDQMTKNCSFRDLPEDGVAGLYSFVTCSYEFDNARTIVYAVPDE